MSNKQVMQVFNICAMIIALVCLATTIFIIFDAQGQPKLERRVCYYEDGSHHTC